MPISTLNNWSEYLSYFQAMASSHVDIQFFRHGSVERALKDSRSEVEYPAMWLEWSPVGLRDNGHGHRQGKINGAFVIYRGCEPGDFAGQDAAMAETYAIATECAAKLYQDAVQDVIDLDWESIDMEPVVAAMVDNNYGWRVSFTMWLLNPLCVTDEKWT